MSKSNSSMTVTLTTVTVTALSEHGCRNDVVGNIMPIFVAEYEKLTKHGKYVEIMHCSKPASGEISDG